MTYEENVRAILESNFTGFKEEVIDTACRAICGLRTYGEWIPCDEQLPEPYEKEEIPKTYSTKLTPVGFSQHDCESHYECPFCGEGYGSWSIPIGKLFKCKCGRYVWTD